ncbi:hypothetical protein [Myxococcus stipitatus]|uniref:hypothetical protein n=1 Tax=Myxococcus stipitatus TaxID=83455 RepID=UPI0030D19A9B
MLSLSYGLLRGATPTELERDLDAAMATCPRPTTGRSPDMRAALRGVWDALTSMRRLLPAPRDAVDAHDPTPTDGAQALLGQLLQVVRNLRSAEVSLAAAVETIERMPRLPPELSGLSEQLSGGESVVSLGRQRTMAHAVTLNTLLRKGEL